jgi:hypothetical protein
VCGRGANLNILLRFFSVWYDSYSTCYYIAYILHVGGEIFKKNLARITLTHRPVFDSSLYDMIAIAHAWQPITCWGRNIFKKSRPYNTYTSTSLLFFTLKIEHKIKRIWPAIKKILLNDCVHIYNFCSFVVGCPKIF